MKSTIFMTAIIIILPVFASAKEPAAEATADTIQVLKISPQDGRAVIKTAEGEMKIIKTGDLLPVASSGSRVKDEKGQKPVAGYELRVVEIADGRVMLEEKKGDEKETIIIRLADGKQKIERIRKMGEKRLYLLVPQAVPAAEGKEPKGSSRFVK
jgi:hypothetical protein